MRLREICIGGSGGGVSCRAKNVIQSTLNEVALDLAKPTAHENTRSSEKGSMPRHGPVGIYLILP